MGEARPHIDIGYRVGILTVESRTEKRKNSYAVWNCRCECGGEIELDTRCLQRGTVMDCGCSTRVKPGMLDLTGMRFGKLTCLELSREKDNSGNTQWLCRCDCGKETVVGQTSLQNGRTKSCGCLSTENITGKMEFIDGTSVKKIEARMNRPPIMSNTSGYNGVYLNRRTGKWSAQITFKGKTYYLGSYNDIQAAVKARKRGEEMYDNFLNWYYGSSGEFPAGKKNERFMQCD